MTGYVQGRIDGRSARVPRGTTILEAARSLGLAIPTLCHHEGLPPEGNCRLCLVEMDGRLAASCMFPLRSNDFEIFTDSETVLRARRFVLELLVNRCPRSPRLLALAREYNVKPDPRFMTVDEQLSPNSAEPFGHHPGSAGVKPLLGPEDGGQLCIRCGRCVRACEINGPAAISLVGRGYKRQVTGPFFRPPEDCVGCRACAVVCPTGAITYTEKGGRRSIWNRDFELIPCESCGKPFATAEELKRVRQAAVCQDCRRKFFGADLKAALIFDR